jgi:hypothetical protein
MEERVVVETPVEGFYTRLGLLFSNFGDVYDPVESLGFGFEDAIQDIRDACVNGKVDELNMDEMNIMIKDLAAYAVAQLSRSDNDGRLSECELVVLLLYTVEFPNSPSLYKVLNTRLNNPNRKLMKPFLRYIWLLLRALVKCPVSPYRMVYRGINGVDLTSHYKNNHIFEWHQFSSCSCSLEVQEEFTGKVGIRTLFTIELISSRGRDISSKSAIPREHEVLLPPNTKFKVVSHFDAGNGLKMIQVVEIPATDPVVTFSDDTICGIPLPPSPPASSAAEVGDAVRSSEVEDYVSEYSNL